MLFIKPYILLFLAVISLNIFAQEQKRFEIAVTSGMNYSLPLNRSLKIDKESIGTYEKHFQSEIGYIIEGVVFYKLKQKVKLSLGFNYQQTNFHTEMHAVAKTKAQLNSSFLQMPLLINYLASESSKIYISGGPYISYMNTIKESGTAYWVVHTNLGDYLTDMDYSMDLKDKYRKFDMGFMGQISKDFPISKKVSITVFSRFSFGVLNQLLLDDDEENIRWNWYNFKSLIGVGLKI